MRKILFILFVTVLALPAWAGKGKNASQPVNLSTERQQQFSYYWYAAKQAIEQKRYADALVLLNFCDALNPNDGQTLNFLGVLYNSLGQKEKAFTYFRRAFEAAPRDQWYKYSMALIDQRTEAGFYEALAVMEKAERLNSDNEPLLEQLGQMYVTAGQWKKALKTQDKLDRLKGYDGYSAINRYRIYSLWEKPRKANNEIDKLLAQDPANIQFIPSLILNNYAYYSATHRGDLKKAEQMSERTIREQPNNPVYLDTYGWIMHLQGQDELALFYLRKGLWNATDETRPIIEMHIRQIESKNTTHTRQK